MKMKFDEKYTKQVLLLLGIIPTIAKEDCFALKGGSAINLFYQELPRLSVDLDLVYLPIEERAISYNNINTALTRIKNNLEKLGLLVSLQGTNEKKIICLNNEASVKIEPNYIIRGTVFEPKIKEVSTTAKDKFGYAKMKVLSMEEIYAGKICAALDRQHPRDLFDINKFYNQYGELSNAIITCMVVYLLQHNRPLYELLDCNIKDNSEIFEKEFIGMTEESISYQELQDTLVRLKTDIKQKIIPYKNFVFDFYCLKADFSTFPYSNIEKLPAIKWKIYNLEQLKERNKTKYEMGNRILKQLFDKF